MSTNRKANRSVAAPMSFAGSAERIRHALPAPLFWTVGLVAVPLAWIAVLAWYAVFGIFVAPYRLIRRGQRKRSRQAAQHQQVLDAMGGGSK